MIQDSNEVTYDVREVNSYVEEKKREVKDERIFDDMQLEILKIIKVEGTAAESFYKEKCIEEFTTETDCKEEAIRWCTDTKERFIKF